jgi:hypothetical protein
MATLPPTITARQLLNGVSAAIATKKAAINKKLTEVEINPFNELQNADRLYAMAAAVQGLTAIYQTAFNMLNQPTHNLNETWLPFTNVNEISLAQLRGYINEQHLRWANAVPNCTSSTHNLAQQHMLQWWLNACTGNGVNELTEVFKDCQYSAKYGSI